MDFEENPNLKSIFSVSRRTDILAFYSDWFVNVLKSGYVHVENPFNHKITKFCIGPENAFGFVFWSRYPIGFVKHFDFIKNNLGSNHYINFTINDYPFELEPRKPKLSKVLEIVDFLYWNFGKNYIRWRFDPIVVSNLTPKEFIIDKFFSLCKLLEGKVKNCTTSFVDLYSKVQKRINKKKGINIIDLDYDEQKELLEVLKKITFEHQIELFLCCEPKHTKDINIKSASCVSPFHFSGYFNTNLKVAPTRKGCTCYKSIDIGFYNSCLFDCIYCYSNSSYSNSLRNYSKKKKVMWQIIQP